MLVFAFTDGNMITVGPKRIRSTEVLLQPGFHWHKSLGFHFLPKELDGTRRVPYSPLGTELTAFTQQQTDCKCRASVSIQGCSLLVSFDGVVAGIVALLCERPQSGISEQQCCMRRGTLRNKYARVYDTTADPELLSDSHLISRTSPERFHFI